MDLNNSEFGKHCFDTSGNSNINHEPSGSPIKLSLGIKVVKFKTCNGFSQFSQM